MTPASADDRPRLLLFANSVQVGGMEEHVRLIAKELRHNPFDVSVVMPEWEETNWFAERIGAEADDLAHITVDRRPGKHNWFLEAFRLARYARARRIDVAHLHSTSYEGGLLAVLAIRSAGVKRVYITEHLAPQRPVSRFRRLLRWPVDRLVTGVISVSDRNRTSRVRHLGGPVDKLQVVDNGIDVSRFDQGAPQEQLDALRTRYGIPDDADIVGTAIRLEPGKGMADLVDGFAQARERRPKAHLLVVGDGSLREALEARCRRLGITDHVTMTGFATEPHPLIELMDVFVIPVPFGSASIGLLEAMAMSKACVISFGGEGEAVVPGESGYWAEPNSPSSIAEYVGRLLDDPAMRSTIEKAARERVEIGFSSERMAAALTDLYLNR